MSTCGTRDAAVNWSSEYTKTLLADGYQQGKSNSCLFHNEASGVAIMVHGDDFIAVGDEKSLAGTRQTLENRYKLKVETLGDGPGCQKEIRVLNKVLRRTADGARARGGPQARRYRRERARPHQCEGEQSPGRQIIPQAGHRQEWREGGACG